MNTVKTIFKKEMHRVFKDRKMLFSTFIFPVLIMVIVYGIMGNVAGDLEKTISSHVPVAYVSNAGEAEREALESGSLYNMTNIIYIDASQEEDAKQKIAKGEGDLLVVFPDGFSESIRSESSVPDVSFYFDPSNNTSTGAFAVFTEGFNNELYKYYLADRVGGADRLDVFTINAGGGNYAIETGDAGSSQMLAMLVPYMVLILLFAGAMTLGTDVIAGEKERGTMAALLLTPASRSAIAMGKLLALTVLSVISAAIYAITLIIMVPRAMSGVGGGMSMNITPVQGLMILLVVIALAFLFVCVITLISVFAKTVKEAQSYASPVMILVLIAGVLTMFSAFGGTHGLPEYAIPVYGAALLLSDIFMGSVTAASFAVVLIVTLAAGAVLTFVISKVFDRERIMLNV